MKRTITVGAAALLALASIAAGPALADPGHGHGHGPPGGVPPGHVYGPDGPPGHGGAPPGHAYGRHKWRKGERIEAVEWREYPVVSWRRHHLRPPPPGYEWRYVDGDYVLAAVATGLILSIIAGQ